MAATRPNMLFLFTDDQRFDTIGALGNPDIVTPSLDRLVERGFAFTQAHIPGGTVGAICMPSRAMLHTGRTLFHLERSGQEIPAEHRTLGETLRAHGYRTFGTGKWHNGPASFHRSFSDGDEIFFGGMADHWNVPAYRYDPTGRYDAVRLEVKDPMRSNVTTQRRCDHIHAGKHSSELVADAVIAFLKDRPREQPFFAYVSFLAPHDPRTMPEEYLRMYDPERLPLPPNFAGAHPFDTGALHIRDEMLASFPRTPAETRRHIAEYYAMITHLDAQIGRILQALDETGLTDETIIVFSADNGLALGQHGLFGKQNCYEHSVRVPLIFAGPGIPRGARSDAYVYLLDIYPTLCELAGVPIPDSVEGQSLVPALHDPSRGVRESLYFVYAQTQRGVKRGRHKLIEYVVSGRREATQLFDLKADPWETRNLAGEAAQAPVLAALRAELDRLSREWDDRGSPWGDAFWSVLDKE